MYDILKGIRVLDLSRYISGPSCARILADMGAEVIKAEKAGYGDEARHCGPFCNDSSLYFSAYNRNKKSVEVDFRSDKGKELLGKLIEKSDIIVENFKAGTMKAMGFGFEEIQKINPRAILVSITGFGQSGPDSKRPAYDSIVTNRSHLFTGSIPDSIEYGPNLLSDTMMGMNAANAAVLALYHREKTGKGQWVDCCMLTCSVGATPIAMADYAANGNTGTNIIDAPNGRFATKDGYMMLISGPQPMYLRLREIIDDPVVRDEQYLVMDNRIRDEKLLNEHIAVWMKERTCEEVDEIMQVNGITCGRINTWQDVLEDRQLAYREDIIQLPVKNCGTVPYTKFPAHFSASEYHTDLAAPELGADTRSVMTEVLGMSEEEVNAYMTKKER